MAYTKADLRTAALRHLGVLAGSETASPEDAALVEGAIDSLHAELEVLGLAYWSVEDIPLAVQRPLARLVANDVAGDFGMAFQPAARDAAIRQIRATTSSSTGAGEPIRAIYY